jgi:hypothetical protein
MTKAGNKLEKYNDVLSIRNMNKSPELIQVRARVQRRSSGGEWDFS